MGHENSRDLPVLPEAVDTIATESMDITPFVTEMLRQSTSEKKPRKKVRAART